MALWGVRQSDPSQGFSVVMLSSLKLTVSIKSNKYKDGWSGWNQWTRLSKLTYMLYVEPPFRFLGTFRNNKLQECRGDCYCQLLLLSLGKPWSCDLPSAFTLLSACSQSRCFGLLRMFLKTQIKLVLNKTVFLCLPLVRPSVYLIRAFNLCIQSVHLIQPNQCLLLQQQPIGFSKRVRLLTEPPC